MSEAPPNPEGDQSVPDEYAMSQGRRPEKIRRRNRLIGLGLLVLIAAVVGFAVWTRATGEAEPRDEVRRQQQSEPPSERPRPKR